jgi:hypothetical protein
VTIDNEDYVFANAYDIAYSNDDQELMTRIGEAFVLYIKDKFIFFEGNSKELFGRQISQILILHGSRLCVDYAGALAKMIRSLGYKFITLETALEDVAYQSQDTYLGDAGITWLHRWAITKGIKGDFYMNEPTTPKFVVDIVEDVKE